MGLTCYGQCPTLGHKKLSNAWQMPPRGEDEWAWNRRNYIRVDTGQNLESRTLPIGHCASHMVNYNLQVNIRVQVRLGSFILQCMNVFAPNDSPTSQQTSLKAQKAKLSYTIFTCVSCSGQTPKFESTPI